MKTLQSLKIDQHSVTIFASGNSLEELSPEDVKKIYDTSFLITLNYAPIKYISHLNIWYDFRVTSQLEILYKKKKKDRLFLTRKEALGKPNTFELESQIDFIFDKSKEKLSGSLTLPIVLQLIQKYFPDKKIYIYGLDMYYEKDQEKWYDKITDYDKNKREKLKYDIKKQLNLCSDYLDKYVRPENVYNCNPKSGYRGFSIVKP